ncbi:MAG TPA: hypothetical protein V6C91_14985, partial [Coleofasciculaceae cyanobacterium]
MATTQNATHRFLNIKSEASFTTVLVIAFLCFALIGLAHHEMWRDELHAWMIARDSSSLPELFSNLRYEGHPALWHVCLFFLSRFTRNPIFMQLFHLAIAASCVYLFARFSPFTRLQKILFTFGYFPLFEYGIISRNYNLGILFIFLFCIFFQSRYKSYLILSVLLVLLANTNAFTFIIAVSLSMTLVLERIFDKTINQSFCNNKLNLILSITIFVGGIILALIQIIPPADSDFTGDDDQVVSPAQVDFIKIERLASIIGRIWKVYVPIPHISSYHFWESNILTNGPLILKIVALFLSPCLLGIAIALLIRRPVILFMYLSSTLGILLFHYLKFQGSLRHSGYLFFIFLACCWLLEDSSKSLDFNRILEKILDFFKRYKNQYLTILLCSHVIAAMFALSMDIKYPFSASKEVVNFIESQGLRDTLTVGSLDMPVSPIAALLDKKIYYPE